MEFHRHFNEFTLTNTDLINFAILCFISLTMIGIIAKLSIKKTKTLAWAISFINSLSMSIVGIIYFYFVYDKYPQFFSFGENGASMYEDKSNFNVLVCVWFGVVNIFDLIYGLLFYPQFLSVLTTYVHHTVFAYACLIFATGNGILFTTTPSPGGFVFSMLEEIPTFLLALGKLVCVIYTSVHHVYIL